MKHVNEKPFNGLERANSFPYVKSKLVKAVENLVPFEEPKLLQIQVSTIEKTIERLKRDLEQESEILTRLVNFGLSYKHAGEIKESVYEHKTAEPFLQYIRKKTIPIYELDGLDTMYISDITGIDESFLNWLMNFKWAASPVIGCGEAFCLVMLKDTDWSSKGGDLKHMGMILEIKSVTTNARLKGQHGFCPGFMARKTQIEKLKKLNNILSADKQIKVPNTNGTEYNFTPTKLGNWQLERTGKELIENADGLITKKHIVNIVIDSMISIYPKALRKDFKFMFDYFEDDGTIINKKELVRTIGVFNLNYYMGLDKIDIIAMLDKDNMFTIIEKEHTDKIPEYVSFVPFDFSDKAGPQGGVFGIKVLQTKK